MRLIHIRRTGPGVSIVECLVGMVIFIMAILPLWALLNESYGQINVTVDDLLISIASSCLVNEISTMSYPEIEDIIKDNSNKTSIEKKGLYGIANLDVRINFHMKDSITNRMLYDYIDTEVIFTQKRLKPRVMEKTYKFDIVIPRLY